MTFLERLDISLGHPEGLEVSCGHSQPGCKFYRLTNETLRALYIISELLLLHDEEGEVLCTRCRLKKTFSSSFIETRNRRCDNATTIELNIKKLSPNLFNELICSDLDLSGNDLTKIPNTIFNNLTCLKYLSLAFNRLTKKALHAGIFDDLICLEHLQLTDNRLNSLPGSIFDQLTYLKKT